MARRGSLWDHNVLILLVLCESPLRLVRSIASDAAATVTKVEAVAGQEALLPCDARPTRLGDSLLLVAWYRDGSPVYSFDTRETGSNAHWAAEALAGRASWQQPPSAGLAIRDAQPRDRAVYTCRVDFHNSPARTYKIALDVVEPPGPPVIFDEFGKEIVDVAGPYPEGIRFQLICTVRGGHPPPRIQWLHNGTVVKSLGSKDSSLATESRSVTLVVENATRALLGTEYTCKADNSLNVPARRFSVRLDLYLKPLTVEVGPRERPLREGHATELVCLSEGARPQPTLAWFRGDKLLNATTTRTVLNRTESVLVWTPSREHNGQQLTCKVQHPIFQTPHLEQQFRLNVNYKPVVAVEMDGGFVAEGAAVGLKCLVDANPPHHTLVWLHNGHEIPGVQANEARLTMEKVSRLQAGEYTCSTSNVEGDASASLQLRVHYRPLCRGDGQRIASALQDAVSVACLVNALPPPSAFEWTLSSPTGPVAIDPTRYTIESTEGKSVLSFTPISESDYGTLSCRAQNRVGWQETPCQFSLVPASRPDPPRNCTVYNLTHDSLDLLCDTGFEGGLQCAFVVEAWAGDALVLNQSNDAPHWRLRRLGPLRPLRLLAYAANARGRSAPVAVAVTTLPRHTPPPELNSFEWTLSWSVAVVIGVILTISVILCLALIASRLRENSKDYKVNSLCDEKNISRKENPVVEYIDDKHPDLIPPAKVIEQAQQAYSGVGTLCSPPYCAHEHVARRKDTGSKDIHTAHPSQNELKVNTGVAPSQREIFTTKSPLVGPHRESRV